MNSGCEVARSAVGSPQASRSARTSPRSAALAERKCGAFVLRFGTGGGRVAMSGNASRWRSRGVRIIRADELDDNTPQTLGMFRRAAVTTRLAGANRLWAGTVTINPKARTGPHHHGDLESVIYVVRGLARMRWGE